MLESIWGENEKRQRENSSEDKEEKKKKWSFERDEMISAAARR